MTLRLSPDDDPNKRVGLLHIKYFVRKAERWLWTESGCPDWQTEADAATLEPVHLAFGEAQSARTHRWDQNGDTVPFDVQDGYVQQ